MGKEGAPEAPTPEQVAESFAKEIEVTADEQPQDVWNKILANYGADPYQKTIRDYVQGLMPENTDQATIDSLVGESPANHEKFLAETKLSFDQTTGDVVKAYQETREKIKVTTLTKLKEIKATIAKPEKAAPAQENAEPLGLDPEKDKGEIEGLRNEMNALITELNGQYINLNAQQKKLGELGASYYVSKVPLLGPLFKKNDPITVYKKLSDKFQEDMRSRLTARFNLQANDRKLTVQSFDTFKQEIQNKYKEIADQDNTPESIDFEDLVRTEAQAFPNVDLGQVVDTDPDEANMRRLDSMHLMNREAWVAMANGTAESMVNEAERDGVQELFIKAANDYKKTQGQPADIKDFSDAADYFENAVKTASEAGVDETRAVLRHFRQAFENPTVKDIENIQAKPFQSLVYQEYKFLLVRRSIPENDAEKLVQDFVGATSRENREKILKERPDELFKAIRNIQTHYKADYDKRMQNLDPNHVRIDMTDSENPTAHMKAARVKALILLSNEAEWLVGNYSQNKEFSGLKDELDNTKEDSVPLTPGIRFHDALKHAGDVQEYQSRLRAQGFNTKDLAILGVKIFSAITFIANLLNSVKGTKSVDEAIEHITKNPMLAVSAGAFYTSNHPQLIKAPFVSEYDRDVMLTGLTLERISKKTGPEALQGLINDPAEWEAIEKMKPEQFQALVEKATSRDSRTPMIGRPDLQGVITDEKDFPALQESPRRAQARFYFYRSFLANRSVNTGHLKEICRKASY